MVSLLFDFVLPLLVLYLSGYLSSSFSLSHSLSLSLLMRCIEPYVPFYGILALVLQNERSVRNPRYKTTN